MATVRIICSECGGHVKVYYDPGLGEDNGRLEVVPCAPCEETKRKLAYEKGWREGVAKYLEEEEKADGSNCAND